jgi:hypothetical protein
MFPLFSTLPLSLELLNKENFVPESQQEDLHSGFLQVPPGSNILVTESGIKEGRVDEKGTSANIVVCIATIANIQLGCRCYEPPSDAGYDAKPEVGIHVPIQFI